jgi:hypothetical protein
MSRVLKRTAEIRPGVAESSVNLSSETPTCRSGVGCHTMLPDQRVLDG